MSKNGRKDPKNPSFKAQNLIKRKWKCNEPYKRLFTDITYLNLPNGKHLYISVIIDTFNYKVLAWNTALDLKENLVIGMLNKIKHKISSAIIHTDHGVHYSAHEYLEWLKAHDCQGSMSRLGNSLDNYPIEHHFSFLKRECLWKIPLKDVTLKLINKKLDEYYQWFNEFRIQRNKDSKEYFIPEEKLNEYIKSLKDYNKNIKSVQK
jgi:transposase InsO family protein